MLMMQRSPWLSAAVLFVPLAPLSCRSSANGRDSDGGPGAVAAQAAPASPAGRHGSCRVRPPPAELLARLPDAGSSLTTCFDYVGDMFTPEWVTRACSSGTYSKDPCPTQGLIGSCVTREGKPEAAIIRHYGGDKTGAAIVQKSCEGAAGRWIPD